MAAIVIRLYLLSLIGLLSHPFIPASTAGQLPSQGMPTASEWQCGQNSKSDKLLETEIKNDGKTRMSCCNDPRPDVCTQQYDPVCGQRANGTRQTFSNGCHACAEKDIIGYSKGECP